MSTEPLRQPDPACAVCGAALAAEDGYLSAAGCVCDACHRKEVAADRQRNATREANVEALLGGLFAAFAAFWLVVSGFFADVLPIKIFLVCAIVVAVAFVRVRKLSTSAWHGQLGKVLVSVSAAIGAIGFVATLLRFF